MEIYALVAGIDYDLLVDYTTQLWEEFVKSISNTNMVDGISCARYWTLIIQYAYKKEGIQVPEDDEKAAFFSHHFPNTVDDDPDMFPTVARISDGILRKVDSSDPVLVAYLKTINPSIVTNVLIPKNIGGPSKKRKESKKAITGSPSKPSLEKVETVVKDTAKKVVKLEPPSMKVIKHVIDEFATPVIEFVPTKSGVLKRLKKMAHKPRH